MTSDSSEKIVALPNVTVDDLVNCLHSRWYQIFRKHAPATTILNLPDEVVRFILDDGIFLPEQSDVVGRIDPCTADSSAKYNFVEFDNQLREIIKSYDGKIFIKLRWSAPLDAQWASSNMTLACSSPADIYLLLKASDFVTHDLTMPFNGCAERNDRLDLPVELVIKKYFDMPDASQYRCFVHNNNLIAISHRDQYTRYDHLQSASAQKSVSNLLENFFIGQVQGRFQLSTYVVDLYITRTDRVFVIDFIPWLNRVDTSLFSWNEIIMLSLDQSLKRPVIRFATETRQGRRYGQNAGPVDFTLGGWEEQMKAALQGSNESSDEEG